MILSSTDKSETLMYTRLPSTLRFPFTTALPETLRLPVNTPVVAPILPTFALPLTDNKFAVILAAVILPLTSKLVNVPTDVIFGWAAVVTVAAVPAVVAAPVNAPTNVVDVTLVNPATVVTVSPNVRVVLPKVKLALANLACASVPLLILLAFKLVSSEPLPLTVVNTPAAAPILPTLALPVTLNAPAVVRLPPDTLPVAATTPAVVRLPPDTLPVAVINPAVPKLPTLALPLTSKLVNVPTLVMFGCAAVVTVPAVVAAPVNAPTNVVDVTLLRPATVVTVSPSVSDVLPRVKLALANLACANVPLETLLAFNADRPLPLPVKVPVFATTLTAVIVPSTNTAPLTAKPPKVPTLVMFGCAADVTVVAVVAAPLRSPKNVVAVILLNPVTTVTVPPSVSVVLPRVELALANLACANVPLLTLLAFKAVSAEPLPLTSVNTPAAAPIFPTIALPLTDNVVKVPTLVMFGCAAVVTVAAVPLTLPVIVELTVKPVSVPTLVIFGCAASFTVFATPAVATSRFATLVVDVTTNGALPVDTFDIN